VASHFVGLLHCVAEHLFDMRCEFIYNRFSPNRMMESFTVLLCVCLLCIQTTLRWASTQVGCLRIALRVARK
jgi:hypothetical protein